MVRKLLSISIILILVLSSMIPTLYAHQTIPAEQLHHSLSSTEPSYTQLILETLIELILTDPDADPTLISTLLSLRDSSDEPITTDLIDFLKNHPLLRERFIQRYPMLYFILLIQSILSTDQSTEQEDTPLLLLLKTVILLINIRNLISDPDGILNNLLTRRTSLREWLGDHQIFTISMSALIIYILLRSTKAFTLEDETIPDSENRLPHAKPGGPYKGTIFTPVLFSAEKSYDEDGTIISFSWDFGDGNTGSGKTIEHQYTSPGIYVVMLTVTDTDNGIDTETTQVSITTEKEESSEPTDLGFQRMMILIVMTLLFIIVILIVYMYRKDIF